MTLGVPDCCKKLMYKIKVNRLVDEPALTKTTKVPIIFPLLHPLIEDEFDCMTRDSGQLSIILKDWLNILFF